MQLYGRVVVRHEVLDRDGVATVVPELQRWYAGATYATGVHPGDVGWHLRVADDVLSGSVHAWWGDGGLAAVAFVEDVVVRAQPHPALAGDAAVAGAVAEVVDAVPGPQVWADVPCGSALRHELVARGWSLDPDPWVVLHAVGSTWVRTDRGEVTRGADDVAGRVGVQRAGFERSTFDVPSWHRMAAGPGFRAELDLVVRADGAAAAAGTAWLSVPGGPAVLEPIATHPDHRGRGFGRAVSAALVGACLGLGACGVSVVTPVSNAAAVAAYRGAGMVPVETLQGLSVVRGTVGT